MEKLVVAELFAPKILNRVKRIEMGGFFCRFYKRATLQLFAEDRHLTICTYVMLERLVS